MKLEELALLYKEQFLDNYYVISTDFSTIVINSQPSNFLHLTGLQRCPATPSYTQKGDFYFDCINKKFTDVELLIQSITKKEDKNITKIKICYFSQLQSTILNGQYLFKDKLDAYTYSLFSTNSRERCQTFICTYNKKYNSYMPMSNQVDINEKYSCAIKYKKEKIKSSLCIPKNSLEGKIIFDKYIKRGD